MSPRFEKEETSKVSKSIHVCLAALLALHQPLVPAQIVVDENCTLADAILAANDDVAVGGCEAGSGADSIELTDEVELATALPMVTSEVTFEGDMHSVARADGAANFRIFDIAGGGPVVMRNLTVTNGFAEGDGGGILTRTTLTLDHTTVSENTATSGGGGIANRGSFDGVMTLVNSTVSDNTVLAGSGGGVLHDSGSFRVINSTVSNNDAAFNGGGVYDAWGGYPQPVIYGSTISGNTANKGGGLANGDYAGLLKLVNSTVSGNFASNRGGAIYGGFYSDVTLINSTVIGNNSPTVGGLFVYNTFSSDRGVLSLTNTLVAYNSYQNCFAYELGGPDGNLDDDGSCGGDPVVAGIDFDTTLSANGGPTETHALLAGSVAIDAGGPCELEVDQRGAGRGELCDGGAFEFDGSPPNVGGAFEGMRARHASCVNLTTGSSTQLDLRGVSSWSCTDAGVTAGTNEVVRQVVNGIAEASTVAGSLSGVHPAEYLCENRTTGRSATGFLNPALEWDCAQAGLVTSPGHRTRVSVISRAL